MFSGILVVPDIGSLKNATEYYSCLTLNSMDLCLQFI